MSTTTAADAAAATARPGAEHVEVAIVGSGFSGLGMAIQLERQQRGRDYVVLEKADEVGGTWRENRYPGCACDVPSHLYSYSFAPNPRWTRQYAPQREILDYLRECAERFGVRRRIRFGFELTAATYDAESGGWWLESRSGARVWARYLVLGVGALHRPSFPAIPGRESFAGPSFHSAAWRDDVELRGKRVAVIGTGASAVQIVPQIAPEVAALHLFQRTPPWIVPRPDRAIGAWERRLFQRFPVLQRLARYRIYWGLEATALGFTVHPKLMRLAAWIAHRHIRRQIADSALREKVTPTYTPGCKRILLADDYYPALVRENVELVTDPIAAIEPDAVRTEDGVRRPVDAIVYATGFRVTDLLPEGLVRGEGGVDLMAAWRGRPEAYLGTTVAGFPNLFLLMGPNTGLGHNSMVFMIEAQIAHVLDCMRLAEEAGANVVGVRPEAQEAFREHLAPRLARAVWASGCQSWYLDEAGQNTTLWPSFTFAFWWRARRADPAAYRFAKAPAGPPP